MSLSPEDVRVIAQYARIALDEGELAEMTDYLNDAIQMLEPIRRYALGGVEPTFHPMGDLSNVMRDDAPDTSARSLAVDDALRNAASSSGRSFRVPSILGDVGDVQ